MAQTSPTCANPNFNLGIQKCASVIQNIFTVSVRGNNVGSAKASLNIAKTLGVGVVIASTESNGLFNITKAPTPTTTPALTSSPTASPTTTSGSCTPNWQIGSWGSCADSQQMRTVTDLNNCGITIDEPDTIQACVSEQSTPTTANTNINQNVAAASLLDSVRSVLLSNPLIMWILVIIILVLIIWWFIAFLKRRKEE